MSLLAEEYRHWREYGGIFDLSARAKLRITGQDRVRYLNGQVTANITRLGADRALPACVTTAKGKLSAEIFSIATADALLIDAEAELRESLAQRLERYIVADDVTLEDVTEVYGLLHFIGAEPTLFLPAASSTAVIRESARLGARGRDVWLPREECSAVLHTLPKGNVPHLLSAELAEVVRLEAGVPRWGREFTEETLPPEAGLDRTHIDYAKGCYIGQEVISRLKSVGHVNRQLTGFVALSGEGLEAGWQIYTPENESKSVGNLTSAGWSFALAKPVALGYLRRGSSTSKLFARPADSSAPGAEIATQDLPFAPHPFSA